MNERIITGMRSAFGLLPLLFASALHAQIILGPESLVCQPRFSDAFVWRAATATNGRETLAVVQSRLGALYLQRLDDNARPLTEHGIPIARVAGAFDIASDGDGFVVVWSDNGTALTLSINSDGVMSSPRIIGNGIWSPKIASNRDGYLVAWGGTAEGTRAMAMRLDGAGKRIDDPFPLTDRRASGVRSIASDGRDYLVLIDGTTLVPVTGAGVAGAGGKLLFDIDSLVHTANGYVGFWIENFQRSYAVPVDPSGHNGQMVMLSTNAFSVGATNGDDVMAINVPYHNTPFATRIRRSGDAIETLGTSGLVTEPDTDIVPGALHTGEYFTITVEGPARVAAVSAPERPLLLFPIRQESPAMSGNVVAWREGSRLRAARAGADAAGRDIADFGDPRFYPNGLPFVPTFEYEAPQLPTEHVVASDGQRALIAWTEFRPGQYKPTPSALKGRMLAADGTLSPAFTIADNGVFGSGIVYSPAAIAAPGGGFFVAWQQFGVSHVAKLDGNGNARGETTFVVAGDLALAPRRDGVLVLYRVDSGTLAAAPFRADLTAAGAPQVLAEKVQAPDLAGDGNGHFLAVYTNGKGLWSQALDENGVPAGSAQWLGAEGPDTVAHVAWNGSVFAIVADANMALVGADGRVLMPLAETLPAGTESVISGNRVATLHRTLDTGLGDENVVFVRSFSLAPPRHRGVPH